MFICRRFRFNPEACTGIRIPDDAGRNVLQLPADLSTFG
jgi:hypothetical protein